MSIQTDWAMIAQKIESAPWGQKEQVKEQICMRLDIHKATLHRYLRRVNGTQKCVERELEFDPDNRLCNMVFNLKLQGEMLHLKRRELATERCIQLLIDMGVDGSDELYSMDEETGQIRYKVSTVNRRLRELGYRDPQPSKRIEADYANQVHMIDFSRSKYFQLWDRDERTGDYMLKVSGKELHYKQDDTRLRTWIVQYMDDFSRLRKVRAYPETNESAFLGLEHLNYVYGASVPLVTPVGTNESTNGTYALSQNGHPLHYLPLEMLRCDNGSFRRARETQAAMEALEIVMPGQMPGSKGGTAKVENRMRSLWQEFELPLAVRLGDGGRIWLSEYNELLEEFCIAELERQHPHYREETKGEVYERGLADRRITQKTTDADMIRIACKVDRRVVDAHLRVSLENRYYSVPQYVNGIPTMGKVVAIHTNKYGELTGKLIEDLATASFELEPWEAASWSSFSMFEQTEKRKREAGFNRVKSRFIDVIGQGQDTAKEGPTPGPSLSRKARDKEGSIRQMPPRVEKREVDSPFSEGTNGTPEHAQGRVFRNLLDAREFVGVQVRPIGLYWKDVAGYFDGMMNKPPVLEHELRKVIDLINEDYDNGKLKEVI